MKTNIFFSSLCVATTILFFQPLGFSDSCVNCHQDYKLRVRNLQLFEYYNKWKDSKHALAGVKCVDCHGGDPTANYKEKAHAAALSISNPESKIHYTSLTETCGRCHVDVSNHFKSSTHYKKLGEGEGPSCVTCHGSMTTGVPYLRVVEAICGGCHDGEKGSAVTKAAEATLLQLNSTRGYLGWLRINQQRLDNEQLSEHSTYDSDYHKIAARWHEFNLKDTEVAATALLNKMQVAYERARKDIASPKSEFGALIESSVIDDE